MVPGSCLLDISPLKPKLKKKLTEKVLACVHTCLTRKALKVNVIQKCTIIYVHLLDVKHYVIRTPCKCSSTFLPCVNSQRVKSPLGHINH